VGKLARALEDARGRQGTSSVLVSPGGQAAGSVKPEAVELAVKRGMTVRVLGGVYGRARTFGTRIVIRKARDVTIEGDGTECTGLHLAVEDCKGVVVRGLIGAGMGFKGNTEAVVVDSAIPQTTTVENEALFLNCVIALTEGVNTKRRTYWKCLVGNVISEMPGEGASDVLLMDCIVDPKVVVTESVAARCGEGAILVWRGAAHRVRLDNCLISRDATLCLVYDNLPAATGVQPTGSCSDWAALTALWRGFKARNCVIDHVRYANAERKDFRLADGSPGRGMAYDGRDVGPEWSGSVLGPSPVR
jgi:hypothetical protein